MGEACDWRVICGVDWHSLAAGGFPTQRLAGRARRVNIGSPATARFNTFSALRRYALAWMK
jgi:hypothetical protein